MIYSGGVKMNISYNIEKLKKIIDNLCTLTGLSMAVVDTKYNYVYAKNNTGCEYCALIQSTARGKEGCVFCDADMLRHSREKKHAFSHICHGGLLDTSIPILKGGIVAGYIIIGRVRTADTPDTETIERITSYGVEREELLSAYPKATRLTDAQLSSLISLVSHIMFENAIEIDYDEFINKLTTYIDLNLDLPLSVKQICADLYVSKNFLYKCFQSHFGKTPLEYITDRRIALAKHFLSNPQTVLTEVAEAVGLPNYTYFSKLFKKKTGLSPREYKKLPHGN